MAYTEGDVLENESGERVQLTADGWQPLQAQPANADVPMVGQPEPYQDPTAPSQTDWKNFGGVTWPGNNPLDMLGAINPSFAGATGTAQAIRGMATRASAAAPAMQAGSGIVGRAVQGVQDIAAMMPESQIAQRMGMQQPGARASERVLQSMNAAGAETAPTRYHQGLYAPDELEALTGVRLSAGQADQLAARADDPEQIRRAMLRRSMEDTVGQAGGIAGDTWNQQRNALRGALDTAVRQRTGIPTNVALDDGIIGQALTNVGDEIGGFAQQAGTIRFTPDDFKTMTTDIKALIPDKEVKLQGIIDDITKMQGDRGYITGEQYQDMHSLVGKMAQTPDLMKPAGDLMKQMEDVMGRQLTEAAQNELRQARYKYRILKRLKKPGVVGPDGSINPRSFGRSWNKGTSDKLHSKDELGKLAETIDTLISPTQHTGNTLQRFISATPGAVQNNLGTGLAATAGTALTGSLMNLYGD